jgi:hypothetical protein
LAAELESHACLPRYLHAGAFEGSWVCDPRKPVPAETEPWQNTNISRNFIQYYQYVEYGVKLLSMLRL